MHEIHKKARKWIMDDDLRSYSLRLTTVILANSRVDFFNEHVDTLLYAELFSKPKLKSYVYECTLQFLRGRFYMDTLVNARARAYGTFTTAKSFSFLTRPVDDENRITVEERMKSLIDRVFVKRKGNIGVENLDLCVDIVVQIAAARYFLILFFFFLLLFYLHFFC